MTTPLLERATGGRVTWLSLVGLLLVPFVIAGGLVWAAYDAGDRLGEVRAAIVNEDEAVEIDGQLAPLGRQLAAGLVDSDEEQNISWELSDAESARKGLEDGTFAATVTIPESFSAAATSFGEDDPMTARQATIDVETTSVSPLSDALLGQTIANVATSTFNRAMTENYLDNIYLGFNQIGDQFREVGDAAGELSDGTGELAKGTRQSADGSAELATGMGELGAAGGELANGAGELANGAGGLANGAGELAGGAGELANGLDEAAGGARELSDGLNQYTRGVDQLVDGLQQGGGDELGQITEGADGVAEGTAGVAQGLEQYQAGLRAQAEAPPAEACEQLPAGVDCASFLAGMSAGLNGAADGLDQPDPDSGLSLIGGAKATAEGAKELADGLREGLGQLMDGLSQAGEQAGQLKDAGAQLRSGTSDLADGIGGAADGAGELADGAGQLADGAGELAGGADQLASGLGQYTTGVSQAAAGTTTLSVGLGQLADGADELDDGVGQFADGLADGAEEIPSYTSPERDNLADVVSQPISQDTDGLAIPQAAIVALLIGLALWIGALATYTVIRVVSAQAMGSVASSWRLMLRTLTPGLLLAAAQTVLLVIVAQRVLDLNLIELCTLTVFVAVAGMVFVAVNHALVAWFGGAGRFIAVALVTLGAATHLLSALPSALMALKPFSPITPVFNGVASIAAGTPGLGAAYGALFIWGVLAVAASWVAIARKRVVRKGSLAAAIG